MSQIAKGTRVRVTYEGVVTQAFSDLWPAEFRGSVRTDSGQIHQFWDDETVEVIAPELEDRAHYLHPNGHVYQYRKSLDRFFLAGERFPRTISERDKLVKMVPEATS